MFVYAFLGACVQFLKTVRGPSGGKFCGRVRPGVRLSLYEVSHCGCCNYFGGLVPGLDREDADAAAAAQNAGRRLDAATGSGAEEVYGEVYGDGAGLRVDDCVDGEGGGRVEERDDGAAVEDAAHPRQFFAHFEGEGGRAALCADELEPEQPDVRDAGEGLAQPRQLFGLKLLRGRAAAHEP